MNKVLVEMKAKSVQEVVMEDNRDPEQTFALIQEFEKLFKEEPEPAPPGEAPPPPGSPEPPEDDPEAPTAPARPEQE